MKNWKTTVGSLVIAIGTALITIEDPVWLKHIGNILIGAGGVLIGMLAKDYDTTGVGSNARKDN